MRRFRVKQWRETFEEVIIEAENYHEADRLGELYPEIDSPVEVVNEVESTLRYEVEAIETTQWIAQFDDPSHQYSAASEPFEVDVDQLDKAKDKAMEWLGHLPSPHEYPVEIPQCDGKWKTIVQPQTATLILTRDFAGGAWLTLIEVYKPR